MARGRIGRRLINEPAVLKTSDRHRSEYIGFILPFLVVTRLDVLHRRPSAWAPVDVILRPKRRRAVQSIFHDLMRKQIGVSIPVKITKRNKGLTPPIGRE